MLPWACRGILPWVRCRIGPACRAEVIFASARFAQYLDAYQIIAAAQGNIMKVMIDLG